MTDAPLSLAARLVLALTCCFRILFDGALAARVARVMGGAGVEPPVLPGPPVAASPSAVESRGGVPESAEAPSGQASGDTLSRLGAQVIARHRVEGALQLLALFQREGRLVDFLQQDVAAFSDADVGAAARVVHEGTRRALAAHATVTAIAVEAEGAVLSLSEGFDRAEYKLTGNVAGSAPYRGVVRHRGWRATALHLPEPVGGHDLGVLAPAEVEL